MSKLNTQNLPTREDNNYPLKGNTAISPGQPGSKLSVAYSANNNEIRNAEETKVQGEQRSVPENKHSEAPITSKKLNSAQKELHDVINSCPDIIRDITFKFSSIQEQVMALYSTVVLTGSLMPHVEINYDNKLNFPSLMLLAVFPPASGKGGVSLIRILGNKINTELINQHKDLMAQYHRDKALYEKSLKTGSMLLPPEKPKLLSFLVPGNISSAKLIEQLSHNGPGQFLTIFETEADAFGISSGNSQHGAHLSAIIRAAFHFEQVSQSRKTDSELLIADKPKLSMILTGTENQISKIFQSNADGLFSRFLIIMGSSPAKWKNVKPDPNNIPLDQYFESKSQDYYNMWRFFKNKQVEVKFNDDQWDKINSFGEQSLAVTHHFTGELTGSIAKRHANMITRMAATLSMIRYYDRQDTVAEVYCRDADFETALFMANCSLNWSLKLYKLLPGKKEERTSAEKLRLFQALPNEFELKDFTNYCPGWTKGNRSLNRLLEGFVSAGLLSRVGHGKYEKTAMSQLAVSQIISSNNE